MWLLDSKLQGDIGYCENSPRFYFRKSCCYRFQQEDLSERQRVFFHDADPKNAAGGLLIPFSGSRQCLKNTVRCIYAFY